MNFYAHIFLLLLVVFSAARAEPGSSPDRYVDGKVLADEVASWVVKTTDPKVRGQFNMQTLDVGRLALGNSFTPLYSPARGELQKWMLTLPDGSSRPDHSVMPHQLIQKAIEISGGNVMDGLVLSWDVLREGWTRVTARNTYPHILKLVDITGELAAFDGNIARDQRVWQQGLSPVKALLGGKVRDETNRGDNFSAWYHYMGVAMKAYFEKATGKHLLPVRLENRMIIWLQNHVFTPAFVDPLKRIELDRSAVEFGIGLARNLRQGAKFKPIPENVQGSYLVEDPKRFGEKWALWPGQQSQHFGTEIVEPGVPTLMQRISSARKHAGQSDPQSLIELRKLIVETKDESGHGERLLYETPDSIVKAHAVELLGYRDDPESLVLLKDMSKSDNWSVADAALTALARRNPPDLMTIVGRELNNNQGMVKISAIRALAGREVNSEILGAISKMLDDEGRGGGIHTQRMRRRAAGEVLFSLKGDIPVELADLARRRVEEGENYLRKLEQEKLTAARTTLGFYAGIAAGVPAVCAIKYAILAGLGF